jgi:hypothetical protein
VGHEEDCGRHDEQRDKGKPNALQYKFPHGERIEDCPRRSSIESHQLFVKMQNASAPKCAGILLLNYLDVFDYAVAAASN